MIRKTLFAYLLILSVLLTACNGTPLVIEISVPTATASAPTASALPSIVPPMPTATHPAPTATRAAAVPTATLAATATLPPAPPTATRAAPTATPDRMIITLDALPTDAISLPANLHLSGKVNLMPFEKQLTWRIFDSAHQVVAQGTLLTQGEYGSAGVFGVDIPLKTGNPGQWNVQVIAFSPRDGSIVASGDGVIEVK